MEVCGHRSGHVRHAVEDRVVHGVDRLRVRRGPGVLEAAALVDRDVDEHGPGLHPAHQVVRDQRWRLGAGDEHGPDHEVRVDHGALDLVGVGGHGLEVALVDPVGLAELVDVAVEQQHLRLHAQCDRGGVHPGHPGADDDHLSGVDAGDPTQENAAPATAAHQVVSACLRRQPPRHLAHRRKQRQRPVGGLHRLVGDTGHPTLEERVCALPRGGQVKIGEEDLPFAHPVVLDLDGLLDLQDQVTRRPDLIGARQDGSPCHGRTRRR